MKILIVLVNIGEIGQATLKSALCGLFRMMILVQAVTGPQVCTF